MEDNNNEDKPFIKHCTNCKHFSWWDGDYVCTWKMRVIEESENGTFWCPFPLTEQKDFHADKCLAYTWINENERIYELPYQKFLEELKENGDENLSFQEYCNKYYKRSVIEKEPTEE